MTPTNDTGITYFKHSLCSITLYVISVDYNLNDSIPHLQNTVSQCRNTQHGKARPYISAFTYDNLSYTTQQLINSAQKLR